ncbi:VOC family protein [Rhodococcoides kroppenstedtii]|uniref:VOC family protein n=1 Tax=Rhodococcoides kroppenstedtii TaxID=293050 RepID=UPI00362FF48F
MRGWGTLPWSWSPSCPNPAGAARGTGRCSGRTGLGVAQRIDHGAQHPAGLVDVVQAIHDGLATDGATIVTAPFDGPFGRTFTVADPDGYHLTLHDRA